MSTRQDTPPTAAEMRAAVRSHKAAARERLVGLRVKLREALSIKKARMREYVAECKRERLAVRGAIVAMRQGALKSLRDEVKAARYAARDQHAARLVEIRSTSGAAIIAARAAVAAQREQALEQARITTHERRRKVEIEKLHAQTLAGGALHGPKLEKLRPLLERARTVPTAPGESKVEALWRYAKAHPEEMHAILEPKAEQEIAKTKVEIAEVEKSARAPSAFELKRAARAERMRTRAEGLRAEAQGAFTRERAIAGMIPMGQPILVGHHSEKRHRRDLERIHSLRRKGLTLTKEAETLERRAAFAETNTAVSSDDPDALPKLRAQAAEAEAARKKMRETNAAIRKGGDVISRLVGLGHTEAEAKQLLERDFAGRIGVPDYKFKNTSAKEKRLKERIRQLETRAASPARPDERLGDSTISEADNRVRITFPSKPAPEVRRALKSAGFRPTTGGAWQRFASANAWHEARRILEEHGSAAVSAAARASAAAMPPPQG